MYALKTMKMSIQVNLSLDFSGSYYMDKTFMLTYISIKQVEQKLPKTEEEHINYTIINK